MLSRIAPVFIALSLSVKGSSADILDIDQLPRIFIEATAQISEEMPPLSKWNKKQLNIRLIYRGGDLDDEIKQASSPLAISTATVEAGTNFEFNFLDSNADQSETDILIIFGTYEEILQLAKESENATESKRLTNIVGAQKEVGEKVCASSNFWNEEYAIVLSIILIEIDQHSKYCVPEMLLQSLGLIRDIDGTLPSAISRGNKFNSIGVLDLALLNIIESEDLVAGRRPTVSDINSIISSIGSNEN